MVDDCVHQPRLISVLNTLTYILREETTVFVYRVRYFVESLSLKDIVKFYESTKEIKTSYYGPFLCI